MMLIKILCFIIYLKIILCHKYSFKTNMKQKTNNEVYVFTKDGNNYFESTTTINGIPTNFNI